MSRQSFEGFLQGLRDLGDQDSGEIPGNLTSQANALAQALTTLPEIDRVNLAALISKHPDWVPLLALCVGLGGEKLKRQLQFRLGTSGWVILARQRPLDLISMLDEQFCLVDRVRNQYRRTWSFADVLVERYLASRRTASGAATRGRSVEDAVEQVINSLGLPHDVRTRFEGASGSTAPCDFAVPTSGAGALIVIAAKGFNSTGSKLSDAVREIEEMANNRRPMQFVYAVVDGIGWLGRQADLSRIFLASSTNRIDGLYNLSMMDEFRADLIQAAKRLGLT